MYVDSIVPEHWPGGGGFSVMKFSLESIYETFLRCQNWWTKSNVDLPLCRYTGCSIKLYQCNNIDYAVKVQREWPANSNKLTYPSCQSSMFMMSKGKIVVPSKKNETRKRPYKKIFVRPPPQMQSKWYFQVDLYKTPLFVLHASAISLDNYFLKPNTNSNCVTFNILNTMLIQNREMAVETTQSWPYKKQGTVSFYFYHYTGPKMPTDPNTIQLQYITALANPRIDSPGLSFADAEHQENITNWQTYINNYEKYWGNVFNAHILEDQENILYSQKSPESFKNQAKSKQQTSKWNELDTNRQETLTQLTEKIIEKLQYNPLKDTGEHTQIYLLQNSTGHGWDPPSDNDLILEGYPLWIGLIGFVDFQIKLKKYTNILTNTILTFKSLSTFPKYTLPIVILSDTFIKGHSPYETTALDPDKTKWYPMVQYQVEQLNEIVKYGPGTPYLNPQKQENVTIYCNFHFKWGGSPPKHVTIENPTQQIIYPIPRNDNATTSLQSPAQAPESTLYSFDYRHGNITNSALTRITNDWSTENLIASITEPTTRYQLQETIKEIQENEKQQTQTEEKVLQQLKQLRQYQQSLRDRIISIMSNLK